MASFCSIIYSVVRNITVHAKLAKIPNIIAHICFLHITTDTLH